MWRPGSKLSTGKSGRPRLDDSWEHNVVAADSNWDSLTEITEFHSDLTDWKLDSPIKKENLQQFMLQCLVILPFCSNIWCCFVQLLQLILKKILGKLKVTSTHLHLHLDLLRSIWATKREKWDRDQTSKYKINLC